MKPDKVQMVENLCLQMAQRGQLTEKVEVLQRMEDLYRKKNGSLKLDFAMLQVSEERLIQLLGQVNEQTATRSKVTVQRRRPIWDDDDD